MVVAPILSVLQGLVLQQIARSKHVNDQKASASKKIWPKQPLFRVTNTAKFILIWL